MVQSAHNLPLFHSVKRLSPKRVSLQTHWPKLLLCLARAVEEKLHGGPFRPSFHAAHGIRPFLVLLCSTVGFGVMLPLEDLWDACQSTVPTPFNHWYTDLYYPHFILTGVDPIERRLIFYQM